EDERHPEQATRDGVGDLLVELERVAGAVPAEHDQQQAEGGQRSPDDQQPAVERARAAAAAEAGHSLGQAGLPGSGVLDLDADRLHRLQRGTAHHDSSRLHDDEDRVRTSSASRFRVPATMNDAPMAMTISAGARPWKKPAGELAAAGATATCEPPRAEPEPEPDVAAGAVPASETSGA